MRKKINGRRGWGEGVGGLGYFDGDDKETGMGWGVG